MDFPNIDPEILNRPLSELELPEAQKTNDGIQIPTTDVGELQNPEEGTTPSPSSDEQGKVPYRRFKKFHDMALDAQREADFWKQRAMETQTRPEPRQEYYHVPNPADIEPSYSGADWERFKALFSGADEEAVKSAYRLEAQRFAAVEQRAMDRAVEAFEQRSKQEQETYSQNRNFLDDWTDEAADLAGRDLSSEEELALLDILDEFSPKDREGKIGAPISAEKALEIMELQQTRSHSNRRQARNAIAQISGPSAGGETNIGATPEEQNAKFNPMLGWRANFQRITGKNPNI